MDEKDKDILKLSKYCKHWADHNNTHKENFSKWRDIAESKGLNAAVENLNKAIEMLDKCNEYLLNARDSLYQL